MATPKDWPGSRLEQNPDLALPPVPDVTEPFLESFDRLGRVYNSGMGLGPLPYAEIVAGAPWADESERNMLRDMSRAYLSGLKIGEDAFGIPPWDGQSGAQPY